MNYRDEKIPQKPPLPPTDLLLFLLPYDTLWHVFSIPH